MSDLANVLLGIYVGGAVMNLIILRRWSKNCKIPFVHDPEYKWIRNIFIVCLTASSILLWIRFIFMEIQIAWRFRRLMKYRKYFE